MNVGEYVRTPKGIIAKIINIQEDTGQYFLNGNAVSLESKNYIADKNITIGENFKHSPNIIDLIEVGDYVNGLYVTKEVPKDKRKKQIIIVDSTCVEYGDLPLNNDEIKTIITHEQMEAMQYRVEE